MSMMSTSQISFILLFSVITLFAFYAKYTSIRPLNFPPGPRGLPFFGSVLVVNPSEPWLTFTQWASSYGDLVHCTIFGRQILVIQTTEIAKALLEQRSITYSDRPPATVHKDGGCKFISALLRYGENWRLHRKLFHQSFRAGAVLGYRSTQLRKVRQLLIGIYNSPDRYQRQIKLYASAVIMSAVYDYETIPNDDPLVLAAERAIDGFLNVAGPLTVVFLEAFPFLLKLPVWFPGATFKRTAIQAKNNLHEMMDAPFRYVQDRAMSGASGPCMVSKSLERFPEPVSEGFQFALKSSSASAFIAGVETTASTLVIFILAMMQYPEVQARAQKDIDAVVGTHRLPDFEDRASLPYIDAILRETLRWHPVFPLGMPHCTTKSDVYNGQYIPEGCVVLANLWAMSRDEVKYPNPSEFMPERFVNQDGELNEDSVAFAFGFGRRVCVGRHFADASLWIAIVHLLFTFKFMKPVDENGVEVEPSPTWSSGLISHPVELKCRVVPRIPGMDADKLMEMIRTSE